MKTYMIGYDLNKSGKNYSGLIDGIKDIAHGYWHHLDSTWLVNTPLEASQIVKKLLQYLDQDDELLVIAVADDWASYGFKQSGKDWLHNSLRPACKV
ncbi:SinR family protein [Brucella pseudogrignonensis]|uniref:SinR family protein n=1 Tax=Brucella pseudogrignonensis TaxID=419475 RepID=UPI00124F17ED|nr:SinR family protein [Brucella pseudogrignonensis]KAB2690557.1 SinR family protein [Brucella pseudogrignonensis]